MAYRNQQHFIDTLEKEGELLRIKTFVDPKLEMAEITDRMSKQPGGGKALLFENTGSDFPVLMNAYGSEKRMCLALGVRIWMMLLKKLKIFLNYYLHQKKEYLIN
jgi:4-hydroxy-3-polyprenylbenzoate decarboxylase